MTGITNLNTLLKSMRPELIKGDFVFCTVDQEQIIRLNNCSPKLAEYSLMIFKEKEGATVILEKTLADKHKLPYSDVWSLITLTVHSDLNAIGFLAALTGKLAAAGISVNVVSAFYHDHLFVPKSKGQETMRILKNVQKTASNE